MCTQPAPYLRLQRETLTRKNHATADVTPSGEAGRDGVAEADEVADVGRAHHVGNPWAVVVKALFRCDHTPTASRVHNPTKKFTNAWRLN